MTDLFDLLRRALGVTVQERDLAGGVVSGEIPLTNELVNRLLAKQLEGSRGAVTGVRVDALGDDRFTVELLVRAPVPIPTVRILASIEQQPQFPASATMGLRWSMPGLGPLALFAGPALAFMKTLPPGLRMDGDRVSIDVAEMLRSRGLGALLPYVAGARVHTRRGAFILQFDLRTPAAG